MSYHSLKNYAHDISFISLLRFLGDLKNARQRPSSIDPIGGTDHLKIPPIIFWWYLSISNEGMEVIIKAINDFKWQDPWVIQEIGNKRVFLPKKITEIEVEQKIDTYAACEWLGKYDPELGQRAHADIQLFAKFFRTRVEEYLKEQESKK